MQDRFKFRAWDTLEERYVGDDVDTSEIYNSVYDLLKNDDQYCYEPYIYEQCTGCRDCSNQLIYEGDILEIAEDMGTSHVVVRWDNEFQKWAVEGDTEADYEFYDLVKRPCDTNEPIDDVGVIGNIHENPELLEEK